MNFQYSPPALQPVGQHQYNQPVRPQQQQQTLNQQTLSHQQTMSQPPQVWQQQQQQQYNMNSSEYSSSTYHIYDQISDLIIIKQQRMERKRQQEQKRKMILLTLITILLVGTLLFLLLQALFSTSISNQQVATDTANQRQSHDMDPQRVQVRGGYDQPAQRAEPFPGWAPSQGGLWPPPMLAPPLSGPSRLPPNQPIFQQTQTSFGILPSPNIRIKPPPNTYNQQPPRVVANEPPSQINNNGLQEPQPSRIQVLPITTATSTTANDNNRTSKVIDYCGEHGMIVTSSQSSDSIPIRQCKCDYGYSGDQCQVPISFEPAPANSNLQPPSPANQMKALNKCQLTNGCNGNGQCNMQGKCDCFAGFFGDDCSQPIERQCDDGIDNDRDGLIDCADSECCSDKFCQNSTLCMTSPDPLDILMRKQPPPPTSSFFQRMQFLIEKFSSQMYSHPKDFNDSRASVIRGRVTYMKQAVTGVRVSVVGQFSLGVTLTREGGYFDLMVNGGGAVTIEFRREPFGTLQKSVRVPWNEIVLMEPVELTLEGSQPDSQLSAGFARPPSPLPEPDVPTCTAHNYRLMKPVIVTAPKTSRRSHQHHSTSARATTSRAVILKESALVQQSILLPGSSSSLANEQQQQEFSSPSNESVSLVYISNRANEFMSTINIQLVPSAFANSKLPEELKVIHLKIVIEGNLFEQMFEPQANLSFTYAWNRRNVYKQKSYGLSTASVSVGYEYEDCRHVIWSTRQIKLAGHDLSISDIGQQWNLNIHHRYNYRDSILQRGDGQNFNLKTDKARVVQPVIGDGYQRQASCQYCDGATSIPDQRLLKPQALASAPDGSIYVGDFNLIRRIEFASGGMSSPSAQASPAQPAGSPPMGGKQQVLAFEGARKTIVRTILELPTTRVPSKYSLALSLTDNKLFLSDIDRYQVYEVREQSSGSSSLNETLMSADESLLPVVGSGVKCQLDDRANCGDGQAAKSARLIEPKAIAFDLSSRMYIADGPNVRMVDADGKMYTILGNYAGMRHTKFPCTGEAIPMHKFVPRNPIDLALSPIDDTLHILDDNVVYKVTQDKRVQIVAGKLAHCLQGLPPEGRKLRATEIFLQAAQSISFNQNGDLFVSEDDQRQQISRVLMVRPEEDSVSLYAGLALEKAGQPMAVPSVDANHFLEALELDSLDGERQRASNLLSVSQSIRAGEYKFNSIAAIAVDQQGRLIVADKMQLRLLSIEPDLPKMNAAGEFEIQSPDNADELLVFNRFGHHIATRETASASQSQRAGSNKYTFQYNVNTSFGQLASVSYQSGNKISIYRDGPHHSVKMIETNFGGQCRLDVSRSGQVHSITTFAPNTTKTSFSYQVDGGLLRQSRDQASGELFDFQYDEFGRAIEIVHTSPKLLAPVACRFNPIQKLAYSFAPADCSNLIVAE